MGEWPAVVDAHHDRTTIVEIFYNHFSAEGQEGMSRGQRIIVHCIATGGWSGKFVPRGAASLRCRGSNEFDANRFRPLLNNSRLLLFILQRGCIRERPSGERSSARCRGAVVYIKASE